MATSKRKKVDKRYFLDNTNNGFDFYEYVLGDLKLVEQCRCENVLNPFYGDGNPGLSIYFSNEMWRFKDYGDSTYSGNVFNFAALHYGLDIKKDFKTILEKMHEDLAIELWTEIIEVDDMVVELGFLLKEDPKSDGVDQAYQYFKEFGISKEVLNKFNVTALTSSVYWVNRMNELKEWGVSSHQLSIVYKDINHCKLYRPGADKFKFHYFGGKPKDFVFGQRQIIMDMIRTDRWERESLIIAAGEKDVMTLTSLGYDAICLNSETAASIPFQLEESIINNYKNIIVLYDIDKTGKEAARQLQKKHGFKVCALPPELAEYGGKDISDYIKLGLDKQRLHITISQAAASTYTVFGNKDGKISRTKMYSGYINRKGEIIGNITNDTEENSLTAELSKSGVIGMASEPRCQTSTSNGETLSLNLSDQITLFQEDKATFISSTAKQPYTYTEQSNSPLFPDEIFANLPSPLNRLCEHFTDKRERDIILFSSLCMLSSFFPTLKSINDGRIMGPNLNFFISAPAASGKGTANWSKKLGEGIQRYLREKYKKDISDYVANMEAYKKNVRKNEELEEPQMPMRKSLFIPANNSVSKVYEMLAANQSFGIIFETEGDTLTGALKNEWGNFSDVIRKCFHHETISLARRTEDELIEVENPHLSVLLTGTPAQINGLIQSVENGFFSRFGFYDFESEVIWKSQFKKSDTTINTYVQQISEQFYRIWLRHEGATDSFVHIPENLVSLVDNYFEEKLSLLSDLHGKDIVASVNRTCVIWQRNAMILTALRYLEHDKILPNKLDVSEQDGNIALKIVDVMLSHLQIVFARMKGSSVSSKLNHQQYKVWESLPSEFDRKQFDFRIKELEIEYKTGEKYLSDYIKKNILERYKHGSYRKKN